MATSKNQNDNDLITSAELARRMNLSRARISQYIKEGILKLTPEKLLSYSQSIKDLQSKLDATKGSKIPLVKTVLKSNDEDEQLHDISSMTYEELAVYIAPMGLTDTKALNEKIKLIKSRIELDRETSVLTSAEQVLLQAETLGANLSNSLLQIPDRICPELVNMRDEQEMNNRITDELISVLKNFAEDTKRLMKSLDLKKKGEK